MPVLVNETFPEPFSGTDTNHPVPMWLGLPKSGGHIQIAYWDWPLADAKSAWVLPGGLLAASSQKSNQSLLQQQWS